MSTDDTLRALYGAWAPLLVQLCHPSRPHQHLDEDGQLEPCESPGKRAAQPGYNAEALRRFERANPHEIDAHLAALARHLDLGGGNLGLVLPDGIFVVDPDSAEATARLAVKVPEAPLQATGRGGHFPVRVPNGVRLRAGRAVDLGDVVADIKTPGSHIAVEPSIHATGAAYAWKRALPSCPAEVPLAPAWLLEALRVDGAASAPEAYERGAWNGELSARVRELLERDPRLRARWEGDLEGLEDTSPSAVDLSVATLLAIAGVPGGEIEGAVRIRRDQAGARPKPASYYERTVGRALASAREREGRPPADDQGAGDRRHDGAGERHLEEGNRAEPGDDQAEGPDSQPHIEAGDGEDRGASGQALAAQGYGTPPDGGANAEAEGAALKERVVELRRKGLAEAELLGAALALNRERYKPPRPDKEVRRLVERACDKIPVDDPTAPATLCAEVASKVEIRPIEWLWRGRIPRGKVTILDGLPGVAKSTLAIDLAARITKGAPIPDGAPSPGPAAVLLCNMEDDAADTIVPRFLAADGDRDLLWLADSVRTGDGILPLEIPIDVDAIQRLVTEKKIVLAVFDPLMAMLDPGVKTGVDHHIRRALVPLKTMAERTGAAVVIVRHLNKDTQNTDPLLRGGGSIGIIGAARAGLVVLRHPEHLHLKVLCVSKSNLAAEGIEGLVFQTVDHPIYHVAQIEWREKTKLTAEQILRELAEQSRQPMRGEAVGILKEVLEKGPRTASEVDKLCRDAGIAKRTAERARRKLGVVAKPIKDEKGKVTGWLYELPRAKHQAELSEKEEPPSTPTPPAPGAPGRDPDDPTLGGLF